VAGGGPVAGTRLWTVLDPEAMAVLSDLWRRQRTWSQAANRAKTQVNRRRVLSLALVVIAAGLGAAALPVSKVSELGGSTCALLAGVALGLLPLMRIRLGLETYEKWSRLRSVSEAIKAEVYTFLAGVDPYRGSDRVRVLRARGREVLARGDDLLGSLRDIEAGPRPLPDVKDVPTYLRLRVSEQADGYYRQSAVGMARKARRVRRVQGVLAVCAVVLGVVASSGHTEVAPWIGVIGTVTGAVIAHSAAGRYAFLQLEYLRTAEQLARIVDEYDDAPPTPERDDRLVADCEQVISFQNEAWMAELVTTHPVEADAGIPPPV
jgi:hypothetical protein